jgi:hypothetical protein
LQCSNVISLINPDERILELSENNCFFIRRSIDGSSYDITLSKPPYGLLVYVFGCRKLLQTLMGSSG